VRRQDADPIAVALAPHAAPVLSEAIVAGGGEVVEPDRAEALVWNDWLDAADLRGLVARAPQIRWVQLPSAGVDKYLPAIDAERTWTSAKGAYSKPVAEHALALGLAGLRHLPARARARSWGPATGLQLSGGRVTVLGAGGITEALLPLLAPFEVEVTVVRREVKPVSGAANVVAQDALADALPGARLVVLALALTPETEGIIGADELDRMDGDAWLVNVARGPHVVTDDLVAALREGAIGGAALDVTEPEPLPDGHALWDLENCLITPHAANTWEMAEPLLAERVRENVERFRQGDSLLGVVDSELGY
jgi:phosphoglycerate dehydrogenase-like enzyme